MNDGAAGGGLITRAVPKPWGRDTLPAPFVAPPGERIGEIWFEPPAALPQLLVKYIFTGEKLSIQTHPDDDQAEAVGLGRQGKEECWLVIDADPGAVLGIGFDAPIGRTAMRAAALDGSIERLLTWHTVKPGDFFLIPANTVHAIGAGISLIEVQQNSDITFRLYDYGRPRELHLDRGMAVANGAPYPMDLHRTVVPGQAQSLVEGRFFRLDQISGTPGPQVARRYQGAPLLVIPRRGSVTIGGENFAAGTCALAMRWDDIRFDPRGDALVAQPRNRG